MKLCRYCNENPISDKAETCSRRCRQAAFRLRRRRQLPQTSAPGSKPLRLAFSDPPYPDLSFKYYGRERSFAGEVDHRRLVSDMMAGFPDGWALCTSERALRKLLPLCPPGARVCPWVKPIGVPPATSGPHNAWEAVVVYGGRLRPPGVRDWLSAQPARSWGGLIGRKPIAFCAWVFDLLGMQPGDQLVDLFPGTGGVARSWREMSRVLEQRVAAVPGRRYLRAV